CLLESLVLVVKNAVRVEVILAIGETEIEVISQRVVVLGRAPIDERPRQEKQLPEQLGGGHHAEAILEHLPHFHEARNVPFHIDLPVDVGLAQAELVEPAQGVSGVNNDAKSRNPGAYPEASSARQL